MRLRVLRELNQQVTLSILGFSLFSLLTSPVNASIHMGEASGPLANQPDVSVHAESLYIASEEVLQLSSVGRLNTVKNRLKQYLSQGGNPRDIHPAVEGNKVVILGGKTMLVTVDPQSAKESGLGQKQLALLWTNLIRRSLGADSVSRDSMMVASRGLSPALTYARDAVMTNAPKIKATAHGMASWYGPGFNGGRCANGERYNMNSMTAAHRSLPFGTKVRVTNTWTGRSAIVRITDRGPYARGRVIDLSKSAAKAIGMLSSGTAPVKLEVLSAQQ